VERARSGVRFLAPKQEFWSEDEEAPSLDLD
jgi:hypothetical protein